MKADIFADYCCPIIYNWWLDAKKKCSTRRERQKLLHIHDNSQAWCSGLVKQYFMLYPKVPNYPSGKEKGGVFLGFPPYSPDLNCVVESVIGELKMRVAERIYAEDDTDFSNPNNSPIKLAELINEVFEEIPQAFVQELYNNKLQSCLRETLECNGEYGPTAKHSYKLKIKGDRRVKRRRLNDT